MIKKPILLLLAALCLVSLTCKEEPDLPDDPHLTLVNPFVGVWKADAEYWGKTEYWQFRTDGTGGKSSSATGAFSNTFSFFIYSGQDVKTSPSRGALVILEDADGGGVSVTYYSFMKVEKDLMALGLGGSVNSKPLEQISGAPAPVIVTNDLIGEYSAEWDGQHVDGNNYGKWSLKYRNDGTLKTCHLGIRHQFENAYALRGNTLVIFGENRFGIEPIIAEIQKTGDGKWHVKETQEYPPPANWDYTKVAEAEWL